MEHVETALPTDGSVDSGSAAATCFSVSGGGGDGSRRQSRVMQPAEHVNVALATDGSVDSGSAAAPSVSVEVALVSVARRRE